MRSQLLSAILFGLSLLFATGQAAAEAIDEVQVLEQGLYAVRSITQPNLEWIPDAEHFKRIYREIHARRLPRPKAPKVNFEETQVVIIFAGEKRSTGYKISLASAKQIGSALQIEIQQHSPKPEGMQAQVITHPYLILKIKKAAQELRSLKLIDSKSKKILLKQTIGKQK